MSHEGPGVVLVTGGSRGLGRAIALRLAEDGWTVVINFLKNHEAAESLCAEITAQGWPEPMPVQADVCRPEEVKRLVSEIDRRFGHLTALVNNAGITRDRLFLLSGAEEWWEVVQTNLASVVNCCRAVLPLMIPRRAGSIVNMTSISGLRGNAGQTAYSASKAAIIGFSKSLAKEVGRYNIAVNCVAPGMIETGMATTLDPQALKRIADGLPLQRLGRPEEVAEVVALLARGRAGFLFGQVIAVDGGATM